MTNWIDFNKEICSKCFSTNIVLDVVGGCNCPCCDGECDSGEYINRCEDCGSTDMFSVEWYSHRNMFSASEWDRMIYERQRRLKIDELILRLSENRLRAQSFCYGRTVGVVD